MHHSLTSVSTKTGLDQTGQRVGESYSSAVVPSVGSPQSNLDNNEIGDAGIESFAGVLGQCPSLTHLNLSGNGIGPDGAESF